MMASHLQPAGVSVEELLEGFVDVSANPGQMIQGVSVDGRDCVEDGLFVALSGTTHHGIKYLQQAIDHKVSVVLCEIDNTWSAEKIAQLASERSVDIYAVENLTGKVSEIAGRFYDHPSRHISVIGVTGTNGKTSCTHFIAQALRPSLKCGVIGTIGIGFPGALRQATHTTPDPVTLQAELSQLYGAGAQAAAMEISSHGLEQQRAAALDINIAVLTNLTRDHLDYHGTMEAYADSKRRLFKHEGLSCAVLNMDDDFGRELLGQLDEGVDAVTYAVGKGSTQHASHWVEAVDYQLLHEGMSIKVASSWGQGELQVPLLGRFNISNLLAVLAVLLYQGVPFRQALKNLQNVSTVPGRMERFGGGDKPVVVVDYAHTPDALEKALDSLREHTQGELICLFGCGGDRDKGKRPQMGRIAEQYADRVIVTDDNPRTEDGDGIVVDILAGINAPERVDVIRSRKQAIAHAIKIASAEATVLIAGKGHEDYQLVGGRRLDFSDRDCVSQILSEVRP